MTRTSAFLILCLFAALFPLSAPTVTTDYFDINSFEDFNRGELEYSVISSRGILHPGTETKEWEADVEAVWTIYPVSKDNLLLGTGNNGRLLRFKNGKINEIYDTGKLAITAIVGDDKGNIYFSAIPDATIYKLDAAGKASVFAEPADDYVWCMIHDAARGLVAGTGPEGRIISIGKTGEVTELLDTDAEHVMCLLLKDRDIYAGTASPGWLVKMGKSGGYLVEHAFDEDEVRKIDIAPDDSRGQEVFIVAVNSERVRRPSAPSGPPADDRTMADNREKEEDEGGEKDTIPPIKERPRPRRVPGKLNGAVYEFMGAKGVRNILSLKGAAILDMAVDSRGNTYAATDQQGKVYMIKSRDTVYEVAFDFKSEQALCLETFNGELAWIGAGMPGAIEAVTGKKSDSAVYFTEALDAGFPAKWGKLWQEPEARMVRFQTRSGNTPEPDDSWSNWETAGALRPYQINSPDARFLQIKVSWPAGSGDAEISSMRAAYTIANQPHYIEEINILDPGEKPRSKNTLLKNKLKNNAKSNRKPADEPSHDANRTLLWEIDNPDNDMLLYELFYKREEQKQWIAIPLKEELEKTNYEWNTESIPDGLYRVKVTASDAASNQPGSEYITERISDPFLVDNRKPDILELKVSEKGKLTGKAKDEMSEIVRLEYSLDGGEWIFFMPEDMVFDEKQESFNFNILPIPEAGLHNIAVRAFDKAMNTGARQIEFKVR